jgi:NADH:ubiquinone oxidoreductase subunit 6 (subunit J)
VLVLAQQPTGATIDQVAPIFFYVLALLTIISAWAIVLTQNIVRMAVYLLLTLLGVAGLYLMMEAELLAAVQLIVYAGGTLILIVFGVMLTGKSPFFKLDVKPWELGVGLMVGVVIAGMLVLALVNTTWPGRLSLAYTGTRSVIENSNDRDAKSVDFGTARLGQPAHTVQFTASNLGRRKIEVVSIDTGDTGKDSVFQLAPESQLLGAVIAPGEQIEFALSMKPILSDGKTKTEEYKAQIKVETKDIAAKHRRIFRFKVKGFVTAVEDDEPASIPSDIGYSQVSAVGKGLLSTYVVPFEVSAVLLLIVMIGAAYMARQRAESAGSDG